MQVDGYNRSVIIHTNKYNILQTCAATFDQLYNYSYEDCLQILDPAYATSISIDINQIFRAVVIRYAEIIT